MSDGSALLTLTVAALLLLPAWREPARRAAAVALLAGLALVLLVPALPHLVPGERVLGERWNWSGRLLALAATLALAAALVRAVGMRWAQLGFTLAQAPGSTRAVFAVALPVLALHYLLLAAAPVRLPGVPLETWLYQASLPGVVEESAFRGVLLALADRAFPGHRRVAGADLGWGAVVVTAAFVAAHGASVGALASVLPAALLLVWLRARTGSLLLPIVVHNLWNLSVYAAHL